MLGERGRGWVGVTGEGGNGRERERLGETETEREREAMGRLPQRLHPLTYRTPRHPLTPAPTVQCPAYLSLMQVRKART